MNVLSKELTRPAAPDPLREAQRGDYDPIGAFDPDNICGVTVNTYPGEQHQVQCLREPHPEHWVHIAACDDVVEYVWRNISLIDVAGIVLTDEGVVCRECGHLIVTCCSHFTGCPLEDPES